MSIIIIFPKICLGYQFIGIFCEIMIVYFYCSISNMIFHIISQTDVAVHKKEAHGVPYEFMCEFCGKEFIQIKSLRNHKSKCPSNPDAEEVQEKVKNVFLSQVLLPLKIDLKFDLINLSLYSATCANMSVSTGLRNLRSISSVSTTMWMSVSSVSCASLRQRI